MKIQKQQGFTIIEVVLVLAIAGLIFLMVFIALPTLQRNQRDTQRRDDLSRFKAQVNQYQANNKGSIPAITDQTTANTFVTKYLNNEWTDPTTGSAYPFVAPTDALTGLTTGGQWTYQAGKVCNGETLTSTGAGPRSYAVAMKLEGSGISCMDNQ